MKTRWQPEKPIPLPEYPRPQLRRQRWMNLNGSWEYAIRNRGEDAPDTFDGKILVPFAVESALSGVQKALLPQEKLWYRTSFSLPQNWLGACILLHFGAVDFDCTVWVNQVEVGVHQGGYLPFTLDITRALKPGENTLVVAVSDPTDSGIQERGKQVLEPKGIWYTAVSGIWQTVWLEPVPEVSLKALQLTPDVDHACLEIRAELDGVETVSGYTCQFSLREGENVVVEASCPADQTLKLTLKNPKLWTPETPYLYDLDVQLLRGDVVVDSVRSYAAMRKFSLEHDQQGLLRFALNNQPLFLYGPLDQGYFPDGLYTAPSEEAMLYDIQFAKAIGCNMIRKHVKVEPARWYYACDRLGMIVWQDMPNGGLPDKPMQATLSMMIGTKRNDRLCLKRFGRQDPQARAFFIEQLREMIAHLQPFACIAVWVPYNESWGQFHAREVAALLKQLDPTRLVDHASGWYDTGAGDFISRHVYVKKLKAARKNKKRAFVISEFGGYSLQLPGHLWNPDKKFGYRHFDTREALTQAYLALLEKQLLPLIPKGLTAAIYTQTSDVEIEVNGYLTYDRAVEKMDMQAVKAVHEKLHL